jgi:predicted phosphodiesterase
MTKKDICRTFRDKYGMEIPTKTLARIILKEHPLSFNGLEDARKVLGKIEGKRLSPEERNIYEKIPANEKYKMVKHRKHNPFKLPKSHSNNKKFFVLPKECNNILMISDLHIPYHDIEATTTALKYGLDNNINTIFINGDLIDNHFSSKFQKDPKKRSQKEEFEATKEFLHILRTHFPTAKIYWAKGNHCIRWEIFLLQHAREIWDDNFFSLENRLGLNELGVELIDDKLICKIGKLYAVHGHHVFKGVFTPVNPARGAFLKAKQSIIVGHLHQMSQHSETTMEGKVITTWSLGCLCQKKPEYSPQVGNGMHGFAHITVEQNGSYFVRNYQIINGKIH